MIVGKILIDKQTSYGRFEIGYPGRGVIAHVLISSWQIHRRISQADWPVDVSYTDIYNAVTAWKILEEAAQIVKDLRAQGWTREDFARELKRLLEE